MTQGPWKKLSIIVSVLLVASLAFSISLFFQLNNSEIQTNDTSTEVDNTGLELDNLKAEDARLLTNYANIRRQINLRLGLGEDCQRFITPDDPAVTAIVQETTDGFSEEKFWKDYIKLFHWVMTNIQYSLDSPIPLLPESVNETLDWGKDFWRTPAETIRDKTGDCEDTAALLTSLLLSYNQRRFPTWVVGVKTPNPDPQAHVAVAIPLQNNQLAIFDTAGHYFTPFSDLGGFGSQDFPSAIIHWVTHLDKVTPDAQVYMVFSEDLYQEFSSSEEFVAWARIFSAKSALLPYMEFTLGHYELFMP